MLHWLAASPAYVLFPMFVVIGLAATYALDVSASITRSAGSSE
jgi:hypothetical protein